MCTADTRFCVLLKVASISQLETATLVFASSTIPLEALYPVAELLTIRLSPER
jgi:hypothetical protein